MADHERKVMSMTYSKAEGIEPTKPKRCLVKAGALILAEIERIDRQA